MNLFTVYFLFSSTTLSLKIWNRRIILIFYRFYCLTITFLFSRYHIEDLLLYNQQCVHEYRECLWNVNCHLTILHPFSLMHASEIEKNFRHNDYLTTADGRPSAGTAVDTALNFTMVYNSNGRHLGNRPRRVICRGDR